jgi:hypothetical protein
MLLHYLLVLSALDGQATHGGEHHDRDREDQGRAHRAHEGILKDLFGELLELLRHLRGHIRPSLHAISGLTRPNFEAVLGRLPEAVHEPAAKLGWKLAGAPGRLILDGNGQTILQEGPTVAPAMTPPISWIVLKTPAATPATWGSMSRMATL